MSNFLESIHNSLFSKNWNNIYLIKTKESQGTYVIIASAKIAARKNGIINLNILSNFIFATAAPTNRLHPYGGVQSPIAKLTAITTPKWTGFIPKAFTVGNNIGAITMIAGTVSKNNPIKSKIKFIKKSTTNGLLEIVVKKVEINWGTFSKVIKVENTVE